MVLTSNSFILSSIPDILPEQIRKSGFSMELEAFYQFENEMRPLTSIVDSSIRFEDSNDIWSIEEYGLSVVVNYVWKKPSVIFNSWLEFINNTKFGLAVRLQSSDSRQRFIFRNGDNNIISHQDTIVGKISFSIKPGVMRISSLFEILLFIKETDGSFFGAESGTIICNLYNADMLFSGDGSMFPIMTYPFEENDLLWKVTLVCDDPRMDRFDQSIILHINENNVRFSKLDLDRSPMENTAFREILSQMVYVIIMQLKSEFSEVFSDIVTGENLEHGSLGEAVHFMIISFAKDYDDPIQLSEEIHEYVENGGVIHDTVE